MTNLWLIRAGRKQVYLDRFLDDRCAFMGLTEEAGPEIGAMSRPEMIARVQELRDDWTWKKAVAAVGQMHRFIHDVGVGDDVVTYDPSARVFYFGTVEGPAEYVERGQFRRTVNWRGKVVRDSLPKAALNSLGAILTIFQPSEFASEQLRKQMIGLDAATDTSPTPVAEPTETVTDVEDDSGSLESLQERSASLIDDRIVALDPYEMQDLVAGVLRAMGYKTQVSPRGADRGVDVFASPDGLGLEEPRIFVEVKHRRSTMGSQEVRSFMGGRQAGDRCLFVSTGGFTKDAKYEAERSNVPLTLVDLPRLRDLVLEHYENLDIESKRLLPLAPVYWPIDE